VPLDRLQLSDFLRTTRFRDRYVAAVQKMKTDGIYQIFVDWHADGPVASIAHDTVSFLHWHRAYIRLFEIELHKADRSLQTAADPTFNPDDVISLPWWNYPVLSGTRPSRASGRIWHDNFMGSNGSGASQLVGTGPFAGAARWPIRERNPPELVSPLVGHNPAPAPELTRDLASGGRALPSLRQIARTLGRPEFDNNDYYSGAPQPPDQDSFRGVLEGFVAVPGTPAAAQSGMHNGVHLWVAGHMGDVPMAPNDPVFWLHHANIDRLWAIWQTRHPDLADQYPPDPDIAAALPDNPNALRADQPMLPWDAVGKVWTDDGGSTLFTTDIIRPQDVHNWTSMGAGLGSYRIRGVASRRLRF
jgi:tyrosinase